MSLFSRTLTEEDVKKKLNIDDFRHLTKDKVIEFSTYLDRMDPEVAKSALAQVPEFALTARTAIDKTQVVVNRGLESNDVSMRSFCSMAETTIDSLRKRLEQPTTSPNERKEISSEIVDILKLVSEKDSENKKHIREETAKYIGGAVGSVALVAASIGLSIALRTPVKLK